jgi:hypothetical protein
VDLAFPFASRKCPLVSSASISDLTPEEVRSQFEAVLTVSSSLTSRTASNDSGASLVLWCIHNPLVVVSATAPQQELMSLGSLYTHALSSTSIEVSAYPLSNFVECFLVQRPNGCFFMDMIMSSKSCIKGAI